MTECMNDGCPKEATWRSEDGYPFCQLHAYILYCAECELENLSPHTASMWILHGRPHGPLGGERQDECEHEHVVTYTYRDWHETGIPQGTVCEDCGEDVELEDTRSFYLDEETGKVTW